jgi:hypothetical protein
MTPPLPDRPKAKTETVPQLWVMVFREAGWKLTNVIELELSAQNFRTIFLDAGAYRVLTTSSFVRKFHYARPCAASEFGREVPTGQRIFAAQHNQICLRVFQFEELSAMAVGVNSCPAATRKRAQTEA